MSGGKEIKLLLEWAKREVEIACNREKKGSEMLEDQVHGIGCYKSALKAFETLCNGEYSVGSWAVTKFILKRMMQGLPLTEINDDENEWRECVKTDGMDHFGIVKQFQCKRMGSLLKTVYKDGHVEYTDVDRCGKVNVNDPKTVYYNGLVNRVMNEILPIKMPYYPIEECIKVYCKQFLVDHEDRDYDTVAILYAIKPDEERIEINRYFKLENDHMIEISQNEYEERIKGAKIKNDGDNS